MPHQPPTLRPAGPRRPPDQRPNSYQRGYDKRWAALRRQVLADQPLCEQCLSEGLTVAATDVDHITPKPQDQKAADVGRHELQSLCHACHSKKTNRDKRM